MNRLKFIGGPILLVPLLFYVFCTNYLDFHQVGIARNVVNGEMWLQDKGGWYVTPPWVFVSRIDTRPIRVVVSSSGRGYSAKLVQFQSEFYRDFVAVEGFRYYWWANRLSFNWGYDEEHRGMRDILRGYAYCSKRYPFIKVLEEYAGE